MHIALITVGVPDPFTGGGGNWMTCYLDKLAGRHQLTMVAVVGKHAFDPARTEELAEGWSKRGIKLVTVDYDPQQPPSRLQRIKGVLGLNDTAILADLATAPRVAKAVAEIVPDIVVTQSCVATCYASKVAGVPRLAIQAEGYTVNMDTQFTFNPPTPSPGVLARLKHRIMLRATEQCEVRMLRSYDRLAYMGYHYVDWAHRKGMAQAVFLSTPVPKPERVRPNPFVRDANKPFTILMIGHLHSTSNRTQLPLLIDHVLPEMDKQYAGVDWRIRLVGKCDQVEARYRQALEAHPHVDLAGPVYPPDGEFLDCDVLFVPVPALTGSRVRIVQGFAFGCPVVAHSANQLGIAELAHAGNLLMGDTGQALVQHLRLLHDTPGLGDRLGAAGKAVYEACYQPDYAANLFEHLLAETWAKFNGKPMSAWGK